MSYTEDYLTAGDTQLLQPLTAAIADVADDVYAESPATPDHDLRMALLAYAGPVFSSLKRFAEEMALQLVVTTGVGLESTDAELKTAVSQMWTPYAKLMEARGAIEVEPIP